MDQVYGSTIYRLRVLLGDGAFVSDSLAFDTAFDLAGAFAGAFAGALAGALREVLLDLVGAGLRIPSSKCTFRG